MDTYFVVRDTNHPEEDLKRNWSAPVGGFSSELAGSVFSSKEEAEKSEIKYFGNVEHEFRFHPAFNSFVEVHYEGLGAFCLDSYTKEEAIEEVKNMSKESLAITSEKGDGYFFAEDVISYFEVVPGRWIFELK